MLHPIAHARLRPDRAAYIMAATGETVSYRQLDERANQGARLLRSFGLRPGDGIAVMMENSARYLEIVWAAERCGLYCTCLSSRLQADEAEYIVRDGDCRVLLASAALAPVAEQLAVRAPDVLCLAVDGAIAGFERYEAARDRHSAAPIPDPVPGAIMLYSSGTTGKPKGIRRPLPDTALGEAPSVLVTLGQALYAFSPDMIYLSPAPLYHAAPLNWSLAVQQLGGTVVVMEHFDPEQALELIEHYAVTHAQWVPTHFVRMLKLPAAVRERYDHTSLRAVWHAAAPCPIPVKQAMIDWWGPIVGEYYAGTEGNGFHAISAPEWLAHQGSVGRNLTTITHICGDDGAELPPRTEGAIFFEHPEGRVTYTYHRDPAKTREATDARGWTTLGDVGWLDEQGYLYLTDRKSFTIISGGVNIYPAEIENLLVTHPAVADVAVIGAPHEEMGEQVLAVVQPRDPAADRDALAAELASFARARLSPVKVPRRWAFRDALPRHDTGKLYKRLLRDEVWATPAGTGDHGIEA